MQFYDRARNENRLFNLYGPYGSTTSPQKEVKNILSPLNEMQFSDRVRIENRLFNLYGSNGSTTCETPFTPVRSENILSTLNDMQFSDSLGLARSDEQYRSKRGIFNLYQIVCIGLAAPNRGYIFRRETYQSK